MRHEVLPLLPPGFGRQRKHNRQQDLPFVLDLFKFQKLKCFLFLSDQHVIGLCGIVIIQQIKTMDPLQLSFIIWASSLLIIHTNYRAIIFEQMVGCLRNVLYYDAVLWGQTKPDVALKVIVPAHRGIKALVRKCMGSLCSLRRNTPSKITTSNIISLFWLC